jgi:hypothetical protein
MQLCSLHRRRRRSVWRKTPGLTTAAMRSRFVANLCRRTRPVMMRRLGGSAPSASAANISAPMSSASTCGTPIARGQLSTRQCRGGEGCQLGDIVGEVIGQEPPHVGEGGRRRFAADHGLVHRHSMRNGEREISADPISRSKITRLPTYQLAGVDHPQLPVAAYPRTRQVACCTKNSRSAAAIVSGLP